MARKRTYTPTQPDDARAHRSVEALRVGLLKLLEHRPFDEISLKELTDAAGLSYPTFFRRFASKQQLLDDLAADEVRVVMHLSLGAFEGRKGRESGADLCGYIQKHRHLWKTLLTGGAEMAMRREFIRAAEEIADTRPRNAPWLPRDLAPPFVTSGIFEILAWWMRQPDDYPLENVVALFDALVIDTVMRPRKTPVLSPRASKSRPRAKAKKQASKG